MLYLFWTKIFTFCRAIFLAMLLFGFSATAFAVPPSSQYAPGETLNPNCSPSSANCSVKQGWTVDTANGYVYNTADTIGIGTSTPSALLDIVTAVGNGVITVTDSSANDYLVVNAVADDGNFIGRGAGSSATGATQSNFFGPDAGSGATDSVHSNFLGYQTGYGGTDSEYSNFLGYQAGYSTNSQNTYMNAIGYQAGYDATVALKSNFFGYRAGYDADNANTANFIGDDAGFEASGSYRSNFIGEQAGYQASSSTSSTFIGYQAGQESVGTANAVIIGSAAGYSSGNMDNSVIIGSAAGGSSGTDVDDHVGSIFLGYQAGRNAGAASRSVFLGYEAGHGAANAGNSIFIGTNAGKDDTVDNVTNLPSNFSGTSILIGNDTDTGGYSDSIALGEAATNTASNQFMVGSSTTPVDTTRINGSGSTQCTITTGTGISCSSDERLKTNITDLASNVLDTITKMRSVKYKWKNDGPDNETHIGFIAQDVQKYYPEIVQKDHDGLLSVNYAAITPVLVQAVRELNQKVENVKKIAGDFKESLFINIRNWLGNAGNGISNLYATVFHGDTVIVKNVCIEDDAGNKTCITKARLDELIDNTPTSVIYSPSNSLLNGDTTLNNDENVEEENTDASDALEETTETEEDGEVLGIDSENSLDENVEEENTNTEESNVDSQQDVEQVEEVEETETLTDTESQESVSGSGLDDTDDSISGSNTE